MITSFKVGAIFEIRDQATPVVQRLAVEMKSLATSTATVRQELQALSAVRISSITSRITAMVTAMDRGATAASAMAASATQGAAAMDASLLGALTTARALTAQLTAAGAAARGMGRGIRPPALPGPPPLPGGGGGRGHGPVGPHFGRVGAHVGPMHVSSGASGAGIATGVGAWTVWHSLKESIEPLHQEAALRRLGLTDAQIASVTTRARATSSAVPGSGYSENVKAIGEMYSVVGLQGALSLSEKMAQVDRAMALSGKGKDEGSSYILTRAGELMGRLTDPVTHQVDLAGFGNILDTMSRVVVATHGKVTPAEWLNYAKQAGPASGSLTEDGLYTTAAVIQAMGGHRAGTAAAAIQRQFAGGVMSQRVAQELQHLGLAQEGDFEVRRGGQVVAKTDAMKTLVGQLQHDPLAAVVNTIAPALERKGFTTPESQAREIYKFIGTGPAQRNIYELLRGREQIAQERDRAKGALAPAAALASASSGDPVQALGAFTKSFTDMVGAIASPTMMAAIPTLNTLTGFFNSVAAAASAHKGIASVGGGIAAGAAAGAGVGFLSGWLGGPVGAGGGALIGAGAGAGWGLWNATPQSIRDAAKTGASWGASLPGPLAIPGAMQGAVTGAIWGAGASLLPGAGATTTNKVDANITVKAETDDPRGLAERLLAEINKLLTQAHTRNLSEGESAASSPFVTGMGLP